MNTSGAIRFEQLNKENYDTWKIQIRAVLIKNDAWGYVSGSCKKPPGGDATAETAVQRWIENDLKAQSDIILAMSPSVIKQVKGCNTAYEIWTKLEGIYESKGPMRKAALLNSLISHKMQDGEDARESTQAFLDIVDKLADMGIEINNDLLTVMMLRSLPESFENFRCAIASRDDLPSPETLRVKILEEYETRKSSIQRTSNQNALMAGKPFRKKNRPKRKDGKGDEKNSKQGNKVKCDNCHKSGHETSKCWHADKSKEQSANRADDVSLYVASNPSAHGIFKTGENMDNSRWCIDSGCTSHICGDVNAFTKIDSNEHGELNLASNANTKIAGRGIVSLTADAGNHGKTVHLNDALHVPDLRTNLLSVAKITDKGFTVTFKREMAKVIDGEENVVLVANRIDNLYYIRARKPDECRKAEEAIGDAKIKGLSLKEWHTRLGHLNVQSLREAIRKGSIQGIRVNNTDENFECELCFQGKMSRSPFPKQSERESNLGDLVHSDVCGPMRHTSIGGNRLFVTFIDDHSGWCEVKFISHKDRVLDEFEKYRALVETQLGRKVKHIQSDNGREYVNKRFDDFLQKHGIARRLTVPHNPEQNGVAERRNRTLIETARCLLISSGLPSYLWAEAVNTANFIRNRCPTSRLQGKTPYEARYGKPPDVSYFKPFGCEVHILDQTPNKSKLAPRSKKGRFVGYSQESKGYRIWIPSEKKVLISRDVKFLQGITDRPNDLSDVSHPKDRQLEDRSNPADEVHTPNEPSNEIQLIRDRDRPIDDADYPDDSEEEGSDEDGDEEEEQEGPSVDGPRDTKRGPGRPRKERTGQPGRPRKLYCTISNEEANLASSAEIPVTQALSSPESEEWTHAMMEEVKAVLKNQTWDLVKRPKGRDIVGSRFVLRNKYDANGALEKRKARIVAKGFSQRPGRDFHETYAPVARLGTIRMAMAIAARKRMHIRQYDVKTAYLNGTLEEEVYMEVPSLTDEILRRIIKGGSTDPQITAEAKAMLDKLEIGNQICRMKKALYGLKQAGRAWHKRLNEVFQNLGMTPSRGDPCLYLKKERECQLIAVVYVDDIIVMSEDPRRVLQFGADLSERFEVKDVGKLKRCLGMNFMRDDEGIRINQRTYITELLQRFGMQDCRPVSTPLDVNARLVKSEPWTAADGEEPPYRELVGCLLYLSTATRPDVAHAASQLSQFNDCFGRPHWIAAKRVLRYLKKTADFGITYKYGESGLQGFVDADWAGSVHDRRSFTGYAFTMNGGCVSWDSRKQRTVALSSTEAEYMALSEAAKEAVYLRRLVQELGIKADNLTLSSDNLGAQMLASNPIFHARTKHIDIRHHFVRNIVESGLVRLGYLASEEMPADVLTKALPKPKHETCVELLGLSTVPSVNALIEGEC